MSKTKEQLEGVCPNCAAQLELGEGVVEGDVFNRAARCPQCDFEGEQIYDLVFSEIVKK